MLHLVVVPASLAQDVRFIDSGQSLGTAWSEGVALGDLDGDGDLDAFVTNDGANKVWLNDGNGNFSDSGQSLGDSYSGDVALGDLDGDNDLDAFVANGDSYVSGEANKVWLNDGNGNFSDSGQSLASSGSQDVALGDLDGDSDLDAFVANYVGTNKVWLNDGNGNFSDSGQSLGDSFSKGIALGDLDGDGDLDAFVANYYPHANKVWLNDGNGNFSDSGQSLGDSYSWNVALGDLDGDSDLDAFVANTDSNKVWLNDGNGNFSDSGQSLGDSASWNVALGDLDGDSDLDAFVANGQWQTNKVWLNDGNGNFIDSGQSLGTLWSGDVALGDLEGDSDLDAFVANRGDNEVFVLVLTTIETTQGTMGTEISIISEKLGVKKGKVLIGESKCKVLEWTDTSIKCLLKKVKKTMGPGTYDVTIIQKGKRVEPIVLPNAFSIMAPEIDIIDPDVGEDNQEITITGYFFGTKEPKVYMDDGIKKKKCKVTFLTMDSTTGESELRIRVPKKGLLPGVCDVIVTNKVGEDTLVDGFTIE